MEKIPLRHGRLVYHDLANIIAMIPSRLEEKSGSGGEKSFTKNSCPKKRVVVATAGTADLPVAEEAAVTLEAANCKVDRIYDVGVAGLHRVIRALPRLQDPEVGCVIVCAGMDGALPSVVGGLVSCPVVAVPTRYANAVFDSFHQWRTASFYRLKETMSKSASCFPVSSKYWLWSFLRRYQCHAHNAQQLCTRGRSCQY